jgi:SPP1 family predicted phage head-tail adaptor
MGWQSGGARHRVTFQTMTTGQDARGGPTVTASDYCTRWAKVFAKGVRELWRVRQEWPEADFMFEVRRDSKTQDLTPAHQATFDGRSFNILGIVNVGQRDAILQIVVRESVD